MILADKIIKLRKEAHMSQEELAEKLGVSRQAVSKWESCTATPDTDRILALSELFGVSCDYLLRDELEVDENTSTQDTLLPQLSLQDTKTYLHHRQQFAIFTALFVMSCMSFVIPGILSSHINIPLSVFAGCFIALAATLSALIMMSLAKPKVSTCIEDHAFELDFAARGALKEEYERKHKLISCVFALSIPLYILCAPLFAFSKTLQTEYAIPIYSSQTAAFILIILTTGLIVFTGVINSCYKTLLNSDHMYVGHANKIDQTPSLSSVITKFIWSMSFIAFMAIGFLTGRWILGVLIYIAVAILYYPIKPLLRYFDKK